MSMFYEGPNEVPLILEIDGVMVTVLVPSNKIASVYNAKCYLNMKLKEWDRLPKSTKMMLESDAEWFSELMTRTKLMKGGG